MPRQWKAPEYEEARRLLERSILTEVFEEVRSEIIEEWRGAESVEQREALHAEDAALNRVIAYLQGMVSELEHAEIQADS